MVAFTWNTNRETLTPEINGQGQIVRNRFRSDIRGKWVNYLDSAHGSDWRAISDLFVSDGSNFEAASLPGKFNVPGTATGSVNFEINQRYDIFGKAGINEAALVLEMTPENVSAVSGILLGNEVRYPNAFDAGADLVYKVQHGRGPRVQRLVRFTQEPSGSNPTIQISWRLRSSNARAYIPTGNNTYVRPWDGNVNDQIDTTPGQAVSIRMGTTDDNASFLRGSGVKPAKVWYTKPDGELVEQFISVRYRIQAADTAVATKLIPRSFIQQAFADGATEVWSDDTSTFYPDPSTEITSVDGEVAELTDSNWSTMRSAAGDYHTDGNSSGHIQLRYATSQWSDIFRTIFLFDSSSIDDGHSVDSATCSFYTATTLEQISGLSAALVGSTPASNTDLANGDYAQLGSTRYSDSDLAISSVTAAQYHDFTVNANGLAAIPVDGVAKFGMRIDADLDDSEPSTSGTNRTRWSVQMAEATGTTQDPKLVVEHSAAAGGLNAGTLALLGVGV